MDKKQEIKIIYGDGFLIIEPYIPEELTKKLGYWHRYIEQDPFTRSAIVSGEYRTLYTITPTIDSNSMDVIYQLLTMPGFLYRIKQELNRLNLPYKIIDHRTPMPKPNYMEAFKGLKEFQLECAAVMLASGGGQISCPTGFGKTHIIGAIIRAYNPEDLKLRGTPLSVVACPEKDIARKNYIELEKILPNRNVKLLMSGCQNFSDDVQVITIDSLHLLNLNEIGILIVDEVHTAATEQRSDKILSARKALKWGVSATPTGRFDGGDLINEGLFGPVIYSYDYQQGVKDGQLVPIEICWIDLPPPDIGLERYLKYKTRRGRYTHGVWSNNRQNAAIIKIFESTSKENHQILCVVQYLDQMNRIIDFAQANALQIPYVHAETNQNTLDQNGYIYLKAISKKERQEIYDKMAAGDIRQIISTYVYKQGVNFPNLSVVINASGGGGEFIAKQLPGRASRKTKNKDIAYVVDFWHAWDQVENSNGKKIPGPVFRDDRARSKFYSQLGFVQKWYTNIEDLPFIKNNDNNTTN